MRDAAQDYATSCLESDWRDRVRDSVSATSCQRPQCAQSKRDSNARQRCVVSISHRTIQGMRLAHRREQDEK